MKRAASPPPAKEEGKKPGQPPRAPARRFTWKRLRSGLRRNERFILFWAILFLLVILGYRLGLDRHVLAALALAWGLATQIFAAVFALVLGWVAAMPVLGPVIVKVITIPVVLLLNGLAFLASL